MAPTSEMLDMMHTLTTFLASLKDDMRQQGARLVKRVVALEEVHSQSDRERGEKKRSPPLFANLEKHAHLWNQQEPTSQHSE